MRLENCWSMYEVNMYLILLILGSIIVWKCIQLGRNPTIGEDGHGLDILVVFGWFLGVILTFIGVIGGLFKLYFYLGGY